MAVEKMKLVNIIGPVADFDRIATNYIIDKDIHLENLFDVVKDTRGMKPFDITHDDVGEVKRFAGRTENIFSVAGWVPQSSYDEYLKMFDNEENVTVMVKDAESVSDLKPPTKLKNNRLFKPFQNFIEMYGLPSYNEFDPTMLFAITYTIIFGMMYGDVGHGFVLGLVGVILSKKKNFLGPILVRCGITSMILGVVFSSVFGYEDKFWHALWSPMHQMMPTLIAAVGVGLVVITIVMIMNIANGIKQKNVERVLFDPNGVAGMVFYWGAIIIVLSALNFLPVKVSTVLIVLFIAVPLVLMFLKEPLGKLIEGRKDWMPKRIYNGNIF